MILHYTRYFFLILLHVLLALFCYKYSFVSKIYALSIIVIGIFFVVKNKNANNEVLYAAGYLVGAEVFLRMTHGNPNYEFGKYGVILFSILGMYFSGYSKKAMPYLVFLLLLMPGTILAINSIETRVLQSILFNISGPVCLAVCAIYTFKRKISEQQISHILLAIGLPIFSCSIYLFLYCPITTLTYFNTESSWMLSGDFGPNQVATVLGLGMFVFFIRLIDKSYNFFYFGLNLLLTLAIFYRGIMTFSRGGMLTSVIMILIVVLLFFLNSETKNSVQWKFKFFLIFVSFSGVFLFATYQTHGLLINRYASEDMRGNFKWRKITTGRVRLAMSEIKTFKENPVFGIGSGKSSEVRSEKSVKFATTHNEMTRLIAEHGILGLAALLILLIIPILLFFKNKKNRFLITFYLFWLLTINHSGMRIAAPSFLYALALLHIKFDKKRIQISE